MGITNDRLTLAYLSAVLESGPFCVDTIGLGSRF